jgi:hypothetical protein
MHRQRQGEIMSRRKRLFVIAGVLILGLLLTGCLDDGGPDSIFIPTTPTTLAPYEASIGVNVNIAAGQQQEQVLVAGLNGCSPGTSYSVSFFHNGAQVGTVDHVDCLSSGSGSHAGTAYTPSGSADNNDADYSLTWYGPGGAAVASATG